MSFRDHLIPPRKVITIRYRDKYVDLVSDTDHYGTMTQSTDGERIEFDFSECRVIGVRDITAPDAQLAVGYTLLEAKRDKPVKGGGEVVQ